MTISSALFSAVTVTVVRDWKIRTARRTNQIARFITVLSLKKNKWNYFKRRLFTWLSWQFLIGWGTREPRQIVFVHCTLADKSRQDVLRSSTVRYQPTGPDLVADLRAVCCKDQLRSCNIEKNRFSQTLPEQRPRWTSSKNISLRSFRFLFIFLEFFLYFALSAA